MNIFLRFFFFPVLIVSFVQVSSIAQSTYFDEIMAYRNTYINNFLTEKDSPLDSSGVKLLDFFEPDSNYRVIAKVKLQKHQKTFEMATSDGTSKTFREYARLHFVVNNTKVILPVYQYLGRNMSVLHPEHLFLPFTDYTNGEETYGGGRYIDLKISDIVNDKVIIDFNHSYNPWCAYSDGYNCPIPPVENHLSIPVRAGEKMYTGTYKERSK